MWITKLVREFQQDLDGGLKRLRGKTLGRKTEIRGSAPKIGAGVVRIYRAGKQSPPETEGSGDR